MYDLPRDEFDDYLEPRAKPSLNSVLIRLCNITF